MLEIFLLAVAVAGESPEDPPVGARPVFPGAVVPDTAVGTGEPEHVQANRGPARVMTPEEIAADAARDLDPDSFYNRPGATRAEYEAEWQTCRLWARDGSWTGPDPQNQQFVQTYVASNPTYANTAGAIGGALGGALGGLIAGAIESGRVRRANREACMLGNGWRLVIPAQAEQERVTAMSGDARAEYFTQMIGASDIPGAEIRTAPLDPGRDIRAAKIEAAETSEAANLSATPQDAGSTQAPAPLP